MDALPIMWSIRRNYARGSRMTTTMECNMDDHMTKVRLLAELRAARSEWDALMAAVGEERMTEPGAAGDGYAHYRDHMPSIRAWLEQSSEQS